VSDLVFGFIIGIANIIPGVSGGTFALILGIYPRLMESVGNYNSAFLKRILAEIRDRKLERLRALIFTDDLFFLIKILIGAVISIGLLSRLIKYFLENHYEVTYGFFLGLILFSIYIPFKLLEKKGFRYFPWLLVGVGLTLFISMNVDPSVKLLEKSRHYKDILDGVVTAGSTGFVFSEYIVIFATGMLAISTMVLPGVSGSFVLLLLGKYYQIISVIARIQKLYLEDLVFLSVFAAGCLCGLMVFVKLFNYVYKKYKDQTIFFLIGLMAGSAYALWPFKNYRHVDLFMKVNGDVVKVPDYKVYSNELTLWADFQHLWPVLASFAVGAVIMFFFILYERKGKKQEQNPA